MAGADDKRPDGERTSGPSAYMVRDPEAFARNLARAVEQGGRALAAYLKPHEEGKPADLIAERDHRDRQDARPDRRILDRRPGAPDGSADAALRQLLRPSGRTPSAARRRQRRTRDARASSGDRRFNDPDWNENPMFSALKQLYLATTHWAEQLVDEADGVDDGDAPARRAST